MMSQMHIPLFLESRPYVADYAASGRARCKGCRDLIPQGDLRLAVLAPSKHHKGIDPNWFHVPCFFQTRKHVRESDFRNFEKLDFEDQQKIRICLNGGQIEQIRPKVPLGNNLAASNVGRGVVPGPSSAAGGFNKSLTAPIVFPNSGQFFVEYAKSNLSHCVLCQGRIAQGEVRISQKDFSSDRALQLRAGCIDRWHHSQCFIRCRKKLEFFSSANGIPGFSMLCQIDKDFLSAQLPKIPRTSKPSNSSKQQVVVGHENMAVSTRDSFEIVDEYYQKKALEQQNSKLEDLKKSLISNELNTPEHLTELLTYNNQEVPVGIDLMLQRVADAMMFGAIEPCTVCKGQIVLRNNADYYCTGYISDFIKCTATSTSPSRTAFRVPVGMLSNPFLEGYTFTPQKRVIISRKRPAETDSDETTRKLPKIDKVPLYKRKLVVSDLIEEPHRAEIIKKLEQFGGKVMQKMATGIFVLICNSEEMKSDSNPKVKYATDHGIPVVSEAFVDSIREVDFSLPDAVTKTLLHPHF